MAADPFLCPICSERLTLPPGPEMTCPACGTTVGPDRIDGLHRSLARLWSPEETDADAYLRRVLEALRAEGRKAFPMEKQSYDLPTGQSIRVFAAEGERVKSALVALATGPWTEELALLLLNVLIPLSNHMESQGVPPRFQFLTAFPLPDPLRALFATTLHARFERLAMGKTEIWDSSAPVDPASEAGLLIVADQLIDSCFQIPLKGTMDDVQPLEDLVLRRFRFPLAPDAPWPPGAYIPSSSLLLIGMLIGRAIKSAAHSPCEWVASPESHFGLSLSTYIRSIRGRGQANVIDKMFKLFENGASDSVAFLARHVVDESKP